MVVIPAYGRDYTNVADLLKDWNAERDFRIADKSSPWNGKYINRQQTTITDEIVFKFNSRKDTHVIQGGMTQSMN